MVKVEDITISLDEFVGFNVSNTYSTWHLGGFGGVFMERNLVLNLAILYFDIAVGAQALPVAISRG
jgi:hypothetical protein